MNAQRRILVPLDGSELSLWAVERAGGLLERPDTRTSLLGVVEAGFGDAELQEAGLRAVLAVQGARIRADWRVRRGGPAEEIIREVGERGHDLVVMSTHGRSGLGRFLFGSVAMQVLQASPAPVLLFRPLQRPDGAISPAETRGRADFRRVLVMLDGTAAAEEILPGAAALAEPGGGGLVLFSAVPGGPEAPERRRVVRDYLEGAAERLRSEGTPASIAIREGSPAEEALASAAEEGAGAVALTTLGRTGALRTKYGSVAERVLREAGLPVLAFRPARVPAEIGRRSP
jgi:nucleotide-binding universal stress UspA family protein